MSLINADGSPAAQPPEPGQRPVDPLRHACQVLAESAVKGVGASLLTAFAQRLAGGARLVTQVVLHLPDGTFVMAAASLNKKVAGGTDALSVSFTEMPVGPGTEKLAGMAAIDRINANLKQAAAAGLDVVMATLLDSIPDRTLEGRLLVLNASVVGDDNVCTGVATGRYGPIPMGG